MKEYSSSEIVKCKISEGMMTLLHRREFNSISITDITREAGVSRATFYRHFVDKVSVVHYYFDKIVERFGISSIPAPTTRDEVLRSITMVLEVIKKNRGIIKLVIKADNGAIILKYLDAQCTKPYRNLPESDIPIKPYIYSGAVYNLILKWIAEDCKTSVADIASMLIDITPPEVYSSK